MVLTHTRPLPVPALAAMARLSKAAKRLLLCKKKRLKLMCLFRFDLSFQSRLILAHKVNELTCLVVKYERNPRRTARVRSTEWCERDLRVMDNTEFRKNFRVSRQSFEKLVERLEPLLRKEETFAHNTISVKRKVAMTLYYLGQGINYRAVGNQFGAAVSTVCVAIKDTIAAIANTLTPELIKFPSSEEELFAATSSFSKFRNCVGAIDGTHIKIKRPKEYGTDYYNRKGYYSILMQGMCDGTGKFTSVSCGYPGSIHDARMLKRSGFYRHVMSRRYLSKVHQNLPLVILGDSAYPQLPWLMVPYAGVHLSQEQQRFNYLHSSSRIIIENAYGQLKGRFRVILKQIEVETRNVELIVATCCTLHNFCLLEKEHFPEEWLDEVDTEMVEGDHDSVGLKNTGEEENGGDQDDNHISEDLDWHQNGQSTRDLFAELLL